MQDMPEQDQSSHILHPGSRKLFSHWEALRAERAYPAREDFALIPVADIMPDMVVVETDRLRNSFRFRLAGSRVCNLFRNNVTATDVFLGWEAFEADVIRKHLDAAVSQYQPALIRMRLTTDDKQVVAAEFIALPVAARMTGAIQLIGGIFPFRESSMLNHTAISARELVSARLIWTEHMPAAARRMTQRANSTNRNNMPFRLISGGKA